MALLLLMVGCVVFAQSTGSDWREAWSVGIEKVEAGSRSKVKAAEIAQTCAFWGAVISAVLSGVLLVTRRWWCGADAPEGFGALAEEEDPARRGLERAVFWGMLVTAVAVGLLLRLPRMELSFYNDEAHTYTRLVAGEWKKAPIGEQGAKFDAPRWGETAFSNKTGNNSFLYSILARAAFDQWKASTGAADGEVCEWIVRLPVLIAGMLTIVVVGLGARRVAGPWAGVAAMWLLTLHPWHLRFSTEARSYGLVMLFVALGVWLLAGAWQTNRWRWWLPYGLVQFLIVYSYPGAAFLVLFANVVLAVLLAVRAFTKCCGGAGVTALVRLTVSALFAAIPALFVMGAPVVNTLEALENSKSLAGSVPDTWWADVLASLAGGFGWHNATPGSPLSLSVEHALENGAWLQLLAPIIFAVLVLLGLIAGLVRNQTRPLVLVCFAGVVSIGALYLNSVNSGNVLMVWYVVPVLPLLAVMGGLGVAMLTSRVARGPMVTAAPAMILGLVVVWGICLARPISIYRFNGKADPRQVVRDARGGDFPEYSERPITFTLWFDGDFYDPHLRKFVSSDEESLAMLDAAIEEAHEERRPLYVYVAQTGNATASHPKVMERLTMSGEFTRGTYRYSFESAVFENYSFKLRAKP
ncbi:glycosyltransferase family 39 protein [Sulfuriroseicoccus oceanibius]|uniref:Glycosyltransferase family 39 protein n=1 Tax=Sulfuriroseicoccus oceanibius TaxID=2707525 RepID=A0A6B3L9Q9_9BACT|nr:glycosyltransferase family 39 protein [Sulfuriroseicoccus oceanibius]QQL43950.1 glycosyltransferase family 39 protein [Sulfuriroseicoccus oceanibius]